MPNTLLKLVIVRIDFTTGERSTVTFAELLNKLGSHYTDVHIVVDMMLEGRAAETAYASYQFEVAA